MPPHNRVLQGRWLADEPGALSVEEGLAQTLQLRLGDVLRFDMAGVVYEARIRSVRKLDWASLRANFFVLFNQPLPVQVPLTYMGAYRAPPQADFEAALLRQFPNVTQVDMAATLAQMQQVLGQVVLAVEWVFALAGVLVLFAALQGSREARLHETALLRALGSSAQLLRQVQRAELLGTGLLAGLLAAAAAQAIGWALAHYVFEFAWVPQLWLPLASALVGALLAWATGWWSLRSVLRSPVAQTLRRLA